LKQNLLKGIAMNTLIRRSLKGAGALVGLLVLFHLVEDVRGHLAWARYLKGQRSQGIPDTLAGFAPPPVPDEANFAAAPVINDAVQGRDVAWKGVHTVGPLWDGRWAGNWHLGKLSDLQGSEKAAGMPLEAAYAPYAPVLEAVDAASRRPQCRFLFDYDDHEMRIFSGFIGFRGLARTWGSRALLRLAEGRNDAALADVQALLRVGGHFRLEPSTTGQLLAMSWLNLTFQPLWEGIQGHRWTEPQLAALQHQLGSLDVLGPWRRGLQFDRVGEDVVVRRQAPGVWADLKHGRHWSWGGGAETGRGKALVRALLLPEGWQAQNQIRMEAWFTRVVLAPSDPLHHRFHPGMAKQSLAEFKALKPSPYTFLFCGRTPLIDLMQMATCRNARLQAGIDQARIACALERYRLVHKAYPETLEALGVGLLPDAPWDVMTGMPMHYRRTPEGGYRLWSLGWEGKDLDGNPGPDPNDFSQGNWCWTVAR
jgi:hypothetical protein